MSIPSLCKPTHKRRLWELCLSGALQMLDLIDWLIFHSSSTSFCEAQYGNFRQKSLSVIEKLYFVWQNILFWATLYAHIVDILPGKMTTAIRQVMYKKRYSSFRGVRNPMKMSDIGFPNHRTKPNWPQNSKTENSVSAVRFSKNRLRRFGDGFSHSQFIFQHDRINSQSIFLHTFMPYLCTSSSNSLTISWTNSSRKVLSRVHTH